MDDPALIENSLLCPIHGERCPDVERHTADEAFTNAVIQKMWRCAKEEKPFSLVQCIKVWGRRGLRSSRASYHSTPLLLPFEGQPFKKNQLLSSFTEWVVGGRGNGAYPMNVTLVRFLAVQNLLTKPWRHWGGNLHENDKLKQATGKHLDFFCKTINYSNMTFLQRKTLGYFYYFCFLEEFQLSQVHALRSSSIFNAGGKFNEIARKNENWASNYLDSLTPLLRGLEGITHPNRNPMSFFQEFPKIMKNHWQLDIANPRTFTQSYSLPFLWFYLRQAHGCLKSLLSKRMHDMNQMNKNKGESRPRDPSSEGNIYTPVELLEAPIPLFFQRSSPGVEISLSFYQKAWQSLALDKRELMLYREIAVHFVNIYSLLKRHEDFLRWVPYLLEPSPTRAGISTLTLLKEFLAQIELEGATLSALLQNKMLTPEMLTEHHPLGIHFVAPSSSSESKEASANSLLALAGRVFLLSPPRTPPSTYDWGSLYRFPKNVPASWGNIGLDLEFSENLNQARVMEESILQNVLSGYLALFREHPDAQENVLRQMTWKKFNPKVLTPGFHQEILSAISEKLEAITFKQHPLLTDGDVISLISRLKEPKTLVLEDCPAIKWSEATRITWGVIDTCARKGVVRLELSGADNLPLEVVTECQRCYGNKPGASIKITPSTWWPNITVQPIAWVHPQWGLPLKFPDALKDPVRTATLRGHERSINALMVLPTGDIVSGSNDKTIKIWTRQGQDWHCTHTLTGHMEGVSALTMLPTGEIVSGSRDNTIKIWTRQGTRWNCTAELKDDGFEVLALTVLPTGEIVSGCRDKTRKNDTILKIWARQGTTWNCIDAPTGHEDTINALTVLATGEIVSGSDDKTIKIWARQGSTWDCTDNTLRGHTQAVRALMVLPTGEIISGSDDKTIKIWACQGATWNCVDTLEDQSPIHTLTMLANGEIVSGSSYERIWVRKDTKWQPTHTPYSRPAHVLMVLATGEIVSAADNAINIWTPQAYLPLERTLNTHEERLKHNFEMLLKSGWLRPHHIALLLPPDLQTLDLGGVVLRADIREALLKHCPNVKF